MRAFLDTNIVLDLLGHRKPFFEPTAKLVTLAERNKLELVVSSLSLVTVSYILGKATSRKAALEKIRKFKTLVEVCNVGSDTIEKALAAGWPDFEDAVQHAAALQAGCRHIITRNIRDFKLAEIPVMSASEFLSAWQAK